LALLVGLVMEIALFGPVTVPALFDRRRFVGLVQQVSLLCLMLGQSLSSGRIARIRNDGYNLTTFRQHTREGIGLSIGWIATIVILASVGAFIASIVAIGVGAFGIYKTGRYAYKDFQAWKALFEEKGKQVGAAFEGIQERAGEISETVAAIRGIGDGIREVGAELAAHPLSRR
jgi:hypothetical protein